MSRSTFVPTGHLQMFYPSEAVARYRLIQTNQPEPDGQPDVELLHDLNSLSLDRATGRSGKMGDYS